MDLLIWGRQEPGLLPRFLSPVGCSIGMSEITNQSPGIQLVYLGRPRGLSSSLNKTRNSTPWAQFGEHQCLLQIASGMAKDEPPTWKFEHTTFTQDGAPSDLNVGEHKPHEY